MNEKLRKISDLLRSNQHDSIVLGIFTALTTCNYEECSRIIPWYYAALDEIPPIKGNTLEEKIYIKDDFAIIVITGTVFCRSLIEAKRLSYWENIPKNYLDDRKTEEN